MCRCRYFLVGGLILADLGKKSIPRNPLLFGTLFRMRLVEHVGSGIKRIRDALATENHPAPLIEADNRWFSVTFRRNEIASEKTSEKTSEKILSLMRQNHTITIEHLSASIGVTERSIERNIEKLRRDGKLKRLGPDRGGHWEVLD
jgi:ATP-dependent DNA helicase RecG